MHHIRIVAGDDADGVGPDEAGDQDAAGEASRVQGAWVGAGAFLTHVILLECGLAWCPRQIGALTRLTVLDLSGNAIEALPVEVGNLTALTEMEVARCVPPLFEGVGGGGDKGVSVNCLPRCIPRTTLSWTNLSINFAIQPTNVPSPILASPALMG